jgi:hypothetical protein
MGARSGITRRWCGRSKSWLITKSARCRRRDLGGPVCSWPQVSTAGGPEYTALQARPLPLRLSDLCYMDGPHCPWAGRARRMKRGAVPARLLRRFTDA